MFLRNPAKTLRARDLRKNQTSAEKIVWEMLRNSQYKGLKFRRQFVLEGFILDFYCMLIQEISRINTPEIPFTAPDSGSRKDAAGRHFYNIRIVCLQVNILFTLSMQHMMCNTREAPLPEP